jgi:hypothetical protein
MSWLGPQKNMVSLQMGFRTCLYNSNLLSNVEVTFCECFFIEVAVFWFCVQHSLNLDASVV